VGRNTAPAVAMAALQARKDGNDPILFVMPADHVIADKDRLAEAVALAGHHAANNELVIFGITPDKPDSNFGYIKCGDNLDGNAHIVERFVEKPDIAKATEYLAEGNYLWNSGMFMFRASRYLTELKQHAPAMLATCERALANLYKDLDFKRINKTDFSECPDDSVDYAVMEKCQRSIVVPLNAGWNDVGFWASLSEIKEPDGQGNILQGDVITEDVSNSFIASHGRLVAAVGIDKHIIIETEDAVLVADKDRSHEVKKIVEELKRRQRNEFKLHKQVYRPWGHYETIASGDRYQVKRLVVKPGKALSLQMHNHRAEHWTVVSGTAHVTNGEESYILAENESTYIPIGATHRLENKGKIVLEVIEVQTGSYLGEDDIVRFDDVYGRVPAKDKESA